jgi:Fe-S-cluster containining protein
MRDLYALLPRRQHRHAARAGGRRRRQLRPRARRPPGAGRGPILKRRPNGDCVYLGENGCTIHDRAPTVCRVFDCRDAYLNFMQHPRSERRRMIREKYVDPEIFEIGRKMIEG